MKLNKLANAILRHSWLIDPRFAEGMMPRVVAFLNGNKNALDFDSEDELEPATPFCLLPNGQIQNNFSNAPQGSIAIINIEGTIMKDDFCGSPGTATMGAWLKEAYANENIIGVILKTNSGGGSVEGTGEFAEIISQRNKPVISYCEGVMGSACYWVGSSSDEIILSFATVEVGCIGTMVSFMDNREALKSYGYKMHYINADSSPDKNEEYLNAIDGDYKPIKVNILNPTNDEFLLAVRTNRAGKLKEFGDGEFKEPLTGKMYMAKKAIEIGLADSIGNFDYAVNRVLELAETKDYTKNQSNMLGNKFKKISALKDKKAEEISEEDINAANEQLQEEGVTGATLVNNSVIEQANANADELANAQTQITDLQKQVSDLQTAKDKMTTDLKASQDEVKRLGKLPGATSTSTKKEGADEIEDDPGASKESDFYSDADAEFAKMKADMKK